jgi:hypothetical protein
MERLMKKLGFYIDWSSNELRKLIDVSGWLVRLKQIDLMSEL